jgi:hypothetical protein
LSKESTEELIISILSEIGESSTSEIIKRITKENNDCIDRVPGALVALKEKKRVTRRLSKEKKAVLWSLSF